MSTALAGAGARTSPADDLRELRRANALRLEQLRARRIERAERHERRREVQESLSLDWLTPYTELLNLTRLSSDPFVAGPTSAWNRRGGRNWPVYQTEAELNLLRAPARMLLATNGYAQGLVEGLTSYSIGPGCTYRIGKVSDRDRDTPQEMVDAVQRIVDGLLERNSWKGGAEDSIESECFGRSIEDGEFILCHYFQEDGWTEFRVRDATELTQPPGADFRTYGFGILTPENDSAKHLKYYLQHGDTPEEGEEYECDEVTHFRRNARRSMKRGVTDFMADTYDSLYLAGRLRTNLGDTAAQQAAIVFVRQHDNAAEEDVQTFNEADADFTQNDPLTNTQQQIKLSRRGGREDIPKGMNYVPGPIATSSPIHVQVLDACLRGAGIRWQAPSWLMSGSVDAMSYASSLTAESPFVKTVGRNQQRYCEAFRRAVWLAVRHYVRTHGLRVPTEGGAYKTYTWEDVSRRLKLSVTAPSPETRNKLEEAQRAQTEITLGVQSRQAYMQEQGRDPDRIEADNQEYQEKFGDSGQGLPLDAGDQQQPEVQAPAPGGGSEVPAVESEAAATSAGRILLENFTGTIKDSAGHERHYVDGKQVAKAPEGGGEKPKAAALDAGQLKTLHRSLADKMPELPADQFEAMGDYTSGAYEEINKSLREGRQAKKAAAAIPLIEKAIDSAPVLEEPVTVYRGLRMTGDEAAAFLSRARQAQQSGEQIQDSAFMSASLNPAVATGFAAGGKGSEAPVVFEIAARKGLYLGESVGGTKEMEMVLQRNSRFKVIGVEGRTVKLEQVL